jgi:hypothetical protein
LALEGDLRKLLRDLKRFPSGAISFCEFGKGGDPGLPDSFLAGARHWIPLELKRGKSVVRNLRPSQRKWHRDSLERDIPTYGATIIGEAPHRILIMRLLLINGELSEELIAECSSQDINYDWLRRYIV